MAGRVGVQEFERRGSVDRFEQPGAHHEEGFKGRKVKCHHKHRKGFALGKGALVIWNGWVQKAHKCLFGAGRKAEGSRHGEGHDESN